MLKDFIVNKIIILLAIIQALSNIIILSTLLINFCFANDILAKLCNGALSDNSQGVKALNLDEMKQVKGGYAAEKRMA
ncbi:hypothetical protein UXU46_01330 [Campylobacter jejuni]